MKPPSIYHAKIDVRLSEEDLMLGIKHYSQLLNLLTYHADQHIAVFKDIRNRLKACHSILTERQLKAIK